MTGTIQDPKTIENADCENEEILLNSLIDMLCVGDEVVIGGHTSRTIVTRIVEISGDVIYIMSELNVLRQTLKRNLTLKDNKLFCPSNKWEHPSDEEYRKYKRYE